MGRFEGAYGDKKPLVAFSADLVGTAEDEKMIITWFTCSEAVGRMSKLVKDLPRDVTKEIVCDVVQPHNPTQGCLPSERCTDRALEPVIL